MPNVARSASILINEPPDYAQRCCSVKYALLHWDELRPLPSKFPTHVDQNATETDLNINITQ